MRVNLITEMATKSPKDEKHLQLETPDKEMTHIRAWPTETAWEFSMLLRLTHDFKPVDCSLNFIPGIFV